MFKQKFFGGGAPAAPGKNTFKGVDRDATNELLAKGELMQQDIEDALESEQEQDDSCPCCCRW